MTDSPAQGGPCPAPPRIQLVASTSLDIGEDGSSLLSDSASDPIEQPESFYTSAQWTADGTTILTTSSRHSISAYVLPEDLLVPKTRRHVLRPQSSLQLPEPSQCLASSPYFSLADPTSQTFLVGVRDHPIQLYHTFPNTNSPTPLCTYKLIRHETEAYITPDSLLWFPFGTHFLVGSANRLDYFDISRPGSDGPLLTIPTIPSKRHLAKGGGVGMKGIVSALAAQAPTQLGDCLTAAGTWSRWIGLYDLTRSSKPVANWSIAGVSKNEFGAVGTESGNGVAQLLWSPCGRYLAINERRCGGILVYDVRGAGRPVSLLVGRHHTSQQRLRADVFSNIANQSGGFELWAGTEHGTVVVWEDVGAQTGVVETSWGWNAHGSPVGSTIIHPSGSVAATCSGAWDSYPDSELELELGRYDGEGLPTLASAKTTRDCNLSIWSVGLSVDEDTDVDADLVTPESGKEAKVDALS
jgi:telomerase Cajal body protein 1